MAKYLLGRLIFLIFTIVSALGQDCSKIPKDIDEVDCCDDKWEDDAVFQNCEKSWPKKDYCAGECVTNATNTLVNGQYKPENLKKLLEGVLKKEPSIIPIAIKGFEECLPMAKEKVAAKVVRVDGCDALPLMILECMYVKMFLNCPADKVKNNKECPEMKTFFTKCPLHIPPSA